MGVQIITPPASEPVTLDQLKAHLRVVNTAEDDLITTLGIAGRNYVEERCGRALITQTWRLTLDAFPGCSGYSPWVYWVPWSDVAIALPGGPAQSVSNVKYYDANNVQQTLANPSIDLSGSVARITPPYQGTWPQTANRVGAVTVDYIVGYGDATTVPGALKAAIKLLAGEMYGNREINVASRLTENTTIENLIIPYRLLTA